MPPGNCYDENELLINITDMLNGSASANLLYTVVCLRRGCGFPVVQVVTHNLRLIVPNERPGSMLESYIYSNFHVHVM